MSSVQEISNLFGITEKEVIQMVKNKRANRIKEYNRILDSIEINLGEEGYILFTKEDKTFSDYSPMDYSKFKRCGVDRGVLEGMFEMYAESIYVSSLEKKEGFIYLDLDFNDIQDHMDYKRTLEIDCSMFYALLNRNEQLYFIELAKDKFFSIM